MQKDWQLVVHKYFAKWLIRFGKIKHVDYTVEELNALITPHFPASFAVDVPIGKGSFTLLEGEISIPRNATMMHVQLLCSLNIEAVSNPLYRAHVVAVLQVEPEYDVALKQVSIKQILLDEIRLVHDEYALLNDSRQLLDLILPRSMQSLIGGTFKSALGLMTAGSSDLASEYLKMYMSGSKQKVLDYHKPQIIKLLQELKQDPEMVYTMNDNDWQESLFRQYGKTVVVEQRALRFKF